MADSWGAALFTGIVEELAQVSALEGPEITIRATKVLQDVKIGDSIALNGCCLTVTAFDDTTWKAHISDETFARTNLGELGPGSKVNLERPLQPTGRLGGHIVQGHVDALGTITKPAPDLEIEIPQELSRYIVEKGSITVDGISLTVVDAKETSFTVAIIPHTQEVTNLGVKTVGDQVNIEVDIMAKYAEKLLQAYKQPQSDTAER